MTDSLEHAGYPELNLFQAKRLTPSALVSATGHHQSVPSNDDVLITESVRKRMEEITQELNHTFQDTHVVFQYISEIHRFYVQIVNTQTGKVLSEIPSREMLDMALEMKEQVKHILATHGVLIDRKV